LTLILELEEEMVMTHLREVRNLQGQQNQVKWIIITWFMHQNDYHEVI
jgi:hypothetical protein